MPALIFDLDGTLVDTVYQHVLAWRAALHQCGFDVDMWRLHRKIGMSGSLLMGGLSLELGTPLDDETVARLEGMHAQEMHRLRPTFRVFPGVRETFQALRTCDVPYAIATSGSRADAAPLLQMLELGDEVPIICKEDAPRPKPDPGLFLRAAQRLGSASEQTVVVGDSVWDMLAARRANVLGVGVLTGGYSEDELTSAGAYRVYADANALRLHLYELGVTA